MLMNFSMYFLVSCSVFVQFDIRKERVCTSVFMDLFSVMRTESFYHEHVCLTWSFSVFISSFPLTSLRAQFTSVQHN